MRLKGTQEQMGAQYGEMLKSQGGYEHMMDFYPKMAEAMIMSGLPRRVRKGPIKPIITNLMRLGLDSLVKHRNTEYAARMQAVLKAANLSHDAAKHLLVMDVLQNTIGVLGRLGAVHVFDGRPAINAIGACTSAIVFGSKSADGELMHARNFDFPGVGVWDKSPTIVYCTPDKGIPYGYIGARGADVPGITAFNAEGLSVTFHTRFHRDVDFNSTGVIDLGHDIVRNARTVAEAIEIVANRRIASTWGIVVTSAKEKNAAVIETTAKKCRVTWASGDSLGNTNHYLHDDLKEGEIATSSAWTSYTVDRMRLLQNFFSAMGTKGGATLADMQKILGADFEADGTPADAFSAGGKPTHRVMGSLIGHVISVKSVVFKLQSGIISLSVGEAPTGWGPYMEHKIDWSGDPLKVVDLKAEKLTPVKAHYTEGNFAKAYEHFQRGFIMDFDGAPLADIRHEMAEAKRLSPQDPSLHFVCGVLSLELKENARALEHFRDTAAMETSPYRKGQALLWAARAADAVGQKAEAAEYRRQLMALSHHNLAEIKDDARKDAARLFPRRDYSDVVLNMAVLDAA